MNGVHDMGGMHGFGAVRSEDDEPVFHQPWEGRVYGMKVSGAVRSTRYTLEQIEPSLYLSASYYERWLIGMETELIAHGTAKQSELDAKRAHYAANPDAAVPRRDDPRRRSEVLEQSAAAASPVQDIRRPPRFQIGDTVRTRNVHPVGHTRLPRYARGKRCEVVRYHGWHKISILDATVPAAERGVPFPVYTVRFTGRELWGESAQPNTSLCLDMWEPYLEADPPREQEVDRSDGK